MARLIEEIILKVGVDATSLNDSLAKISKRVLSLNTKFGKLGDTTGKLEDDLSSAGDNAKKAGDKFDKLEDEINPLDKGFDKLTKSLKKYNREAKKTKKESAGLSSGLKTVAGAAAGIVSVSLITDRINALTEAAQDADRLGIVTQNLIDLQNVGKSFGATAEDVTQGIKNINESASEALKEGKGGKFDLFKELNIDLNEFNKLKPDAQLESFSKSISGVQDQGRRTAIQLALMGEEGFKLSTTFDVLAESADAAKSKVRGFTGEIDPEQIKKMNDRLSETKLRFEGLANGLIGLGTDVFFAIDDKVQTLIFSMHGLNKAQDDYNKLLREAQKESDRAAAAMDAEKAARIRQNREDTQAQKEINELNRLALEELNDPKRLESIENSPEIQAKVAAERKRLSELAVDEEIKAIERKERKEEKAKEKSKKSSLKAIKDVGDSRKKEFIKRLQEESKRGGAGGIIEAGSVEEAEIAASLQNRDAGKLSQADTLQKQFDAEEKMREDEKLKIAKETLDAIKKQKGQIKVNTRSL